MSNDQTEALRLLALEPLPELKDLPDRGFADAPAVTVDAVEWEADLAVATLLEKVRGVRAADALVRSGGWRPTEVPPSIHDSTVDVVGGSPAVVAAVSRRLHALGAETVDPGDPAATPAAFVLALDSGDERGNAAPRTHQGATVIAVHPSNSPAPTLSASAEARRRVAAVVRQLGDAGNAKSRHASAVDV
jgi:hypothetical protein